MKRLLYAGMLVALFALCAATPVKKSNLSILYVSGASDWTKTDAANHQQHVRARAVAFETMLKEYFTPVTVVAAADYKQEMSSRHDVTVMDGTPPQLKPASMEYDANGQPARYINATYLAEDFDRPMLLVGERAPELGRAIGLKLDWYCLCLDADAHGIRAGHAIFKGPFPVKLTTRMKPTPESAFHYPYLTDGPIPGSIPMWQVQTKGYSTDDNFPTGMVSRAWGFEDSPDAEIISGGVSSKSLDAVAIGRHGNFFLWGFAASPAYLTDEAKAVLANAIVYISRFAGQGPIARKYDEGIATRGHLKELKFLASRKGYETLQEADAAARREIERMQQKIKERADKGEKLSEYDAQILNIKQAPFSLSFEEYLKRYQRGYFSRFGTDTTAYIAFYDANRDYFYGEGYGVVLDEDAKSLGIPNNDLRLLDAAIRLLEEGREVDKARRVLARYTLVDFPTAKEWRTWYKENKSRLFFTESGGWVWLVNSREPGVNDYHAKEARQKIAAIPVGETSDRAPVSVSTGVIDNPAGTRELVVK
ncbi:MAG: DUF4200 domain-containing protein, partial [Odoribacteraceae bacterium]|nr:DUF4200 domain-containing protein [Odoribacteraceae bacterium]